MRCYCILEISSIFPKLIFDVRSFYKKMCLKNKFLVLIEINDPLEESSDRSMELKHIMLMTAC